MQVELDTMNAKVQRLQSDTMKERKAADDGYKRLMYATSVT